MPTQPTPELNPNEGVEQTLEMMLEHQSRTAEETNQNLELQLEGQGKILEKLAPTRFSVEVGDGAEQVVIEGPQGEPGPQGPAPVKGKDYFTAEEVNDIIEKVKKQIPAPKDGKTPVKGEDYYTDADIGNLIQEIRPFFPQGRPGKDGRDGLDAEVDINEIVEKVVKKIKLPKPDKVKLDTPEEQAEKLNSLPKGKRISYDSLDDLPNLSTYKGRGHVSSKTQDLQVTVSATAPENPTINDLWFDIS